MKCEQDGITYFQIPEWDYQGLTVHGFFGREGGVSPPPFGSLNVGTFLGDQPHRVTQNLERIAKVLGTTERPIMYMRQVHGDQILNITNKAPPPEERSVSTLQGDGFCSDRTDILLAVRTADCLPIFLLDPIRPAVAIVHAGWRGTLKKILKKCLREMSRVFDTKPEMTRVAFGPGIHSCCFIVDKDVADRFYEVFPYHRDIVSCAPEGKWRVDLYRANTWTMLQEGVPEKNLFYEPLCTCCHNQVFFSVRADGKTTGRQISLIGLRPF